MKIISEGLQTRRIPFKVTRSPSDRDFVSADLVVAIGGDGDVLRVLHQMKTKVTPILGVNEADEESFLTTVKASDLTEALDNIVSSNFEVEEAMRISVLIDDVEISHALNEVAIFPSKSATTIEYLLRLDGESIWRDVSDGLIISTPTGSTAYAMSAGGPIVHPSSDVFVAVPVNSLDVTRRPIVVSADLAVEVEELSSRYECEAVVDGTFRKNVKERLVVRKAAQPAKIVRLPEAAPTMSKMVRKVKLAEELLKIPPSAKLVLKTLEYEGPLTQKDLVKKTLLPARTARLALTLLSALGLIKKQSLLRDTRQSLYAVEQLPAD